MTIGSTHRRPGRRGRRWIAATLATIPAAMPACRAETGSKKPRAAATQNAELVRNAEKGPVRCRLTVRPREAAAGQPVTMTVCVESEAGVEIRWPELGKVFGDFLVRKVEERPDERTDEIVRLQRVYQLESYLPGEALLPAFTVAFVDARTRPDDGGNADEDSVRTAQLRIKIHDALADVKGPVTLDWLAWRTLVYWLAGILAAVALVALAARRLRRRTGRPSPARPARPVIPHEWALAELDMLLAEGLVERGLVREFYYRINALLRRYIELRFGLMAAEQTSEEFLRSLRHSAALDAAHKQLLQRFVAACDPVKYARQHPDADQIDWVKTSARDFILSTIPQPQPEGRPAQEAAV